ncbi:MAG: ABC transporter ATP-binding protein [Spirochaetaceae bacterium]|jgi:putative spermidine/putrescine transport system ATP-binding protein|nr:ABC transporter ATP-binding protein [Spirochaetaceae bacterium]
MLIEFNQVRFQQGDFILHAHLSMPQGKMICLLGPSGSGKTTLLRLLAGFETPQQGKILLQDRDITHQPAWKRRLGYLFQDLALFPHMRVDENICFGLSMDNIPKEQQKMRLKELLTLVDLEGYEKRQVQQLSGGERQRVALARALAPNPACLMLDEPLSALDASVRERLGRHIRKIQQYQNLTTIFVTHDQDEAMRLSDYIYIMKDGEMLEGGSPEELYEKPVYSWTAQFLGDGILLPILAEKSNKITTVWGDFILEKNEDIEGLTWKKEASNPIKKDRILIRPQWITLGRGNKKARVLSREFGPKGYRLEMQFKDQNFILYSQKNIEAGQWVNMECDKVHRLRCL